MSQSSGIWVNPDAIRRLLTDIKNVWDREGLGDGPAASDPLYRRLCEALRQLDPEVTE
jgi:hypothetical protein